MGKESIVLLDGNKSHSFCTNGCSNVIFATHGNNISLALLVTILSDVETSWLGGI